MHTHPIIGRVRIYTVLINQSPNSIYPTTLHCIVDRLLAIL